MAIERDRWLTRGLCGYERYGWLREGCVPNKRDVWLRAGWVAKMIAPLLVTASSLGSNPNILQKS